MGILTHTKTITHARGIHHAHIMYLYMYTHYVLVYVHTLCTCICTHTMYTPLVHTCTKALAGPPPAEINNRARRQRREAELGLAAVCVICVLCAMN